MIRHVVVTAAIVKNVGHVFHFVYLSVCLSVCLEDYWKSCGPTLMKISGGE